MPALLLAALALALSPLAQSLTLPSHIASSMVLQRDVPVPIWGLDAAGASITATYRGSPLPPVTADASGRFSLTLPSSPKNATPDALLLRSSAGPVLSLLDLVVGDVYLCSGQSNAAIPVSWSLYYNVSLAAAASLGDRLRLLTVASLAENVNATTPADNFTASQPWARATAATAAPFSALCYHFAEEALAAQPDVPIGLMANPWGGVPIEVWMSPAALAACPAPAAQAQLPPMAAAAAAAMAAADRAALRSSATPQKPSCLYNSMMHPLLSVPITAFLWYRKFCTSRRAPALTSCTRRPPISPPPFSLPSLLHTEGEANAGDPLGYHCKQRAMVEDLRASWASVGAAPVLPFAFVQLSCWPTGPAAPSMLADFRYTQSLLALEPRTGMVVSADLCDPAGAFHPIHPPFKQEVARRAWLWAEAEVHGSGTSPRAAPALQHLAWQPWEAGWGDYHYGTGAGSYVCGSGGQFTCGGLQLTFDRPVSLSAFYAPRLPSPGVPSAYSWAQGAASGFTLASTGGWEQPVALTGLSPDGLTVFLNVTYIGPGQPVGAELRYAWSDYPSAMPLVEAGTGLPVAPFNATVARWPPRPSSGNCSFMADMDGNSEGLEVAGGSLEECCAACWADDRCAAAAFAASAPACWLKFGTATMAKAGTTLCVIDYPGA